MRRYFSKVWIQSCLQLFPIAVVMLTACNVPKYIPENEELYTGADVKVIPVGEVKHTKSLKGDLKSVIRPKPNSHILGMYPKLWFGHVLGKTKEKGFKHWLFKTLAEKPVLMKDVEPQSNVEVMMHEMEYKGYFHSMANYFIKHNDNRHTAHILYTAKVKPRYTIQSIKIERPLDTVGKYISRSMKRTVLHVGDPYDLKKLEEERTRLDTRLKNLGFYFFNADFIQFKIDTTVGLNQLALTYSIKDNIMDKALRPYKMHDIYIFTNYSLSKDTLVNNAFAVKDPDNGYYFVNDQEIVKNAPLARNITLESGAFYSKKKQDATVGRLMGMGVFKFANLKIQTAPPPDSINKLDALIYLTPSRKKSLRAEVEGKTKSNNYTGPEINLNFRNRSAFKGAELLVLNLKGGFETQFGGGSDGINSYTLGSSAQILLPYFVSPFKLKKASNEYVPKTKFKLAFDLLDRVKYYNVQSYTFTYGYQWQEIKTKQHEINPIALTYVHLSDTTPAFGEILRRNVFLKKSFLEQFILGSNYTFTYNNQIRQQQKNQIYFSGTADVAGNAISTLQKGLGVRKNDDGTYHIFGRTYSQYIKGSTDTRYTYNISNKSSVATRLIVGAGYPYGNSTVMPYIKQFFIGGANSIRAFRARSLGPGTYKLPDSLSRAFSDQSGDIKLEANIEYRFNIVSIIKGAFFADAGNIWLMQDNPQLPGGVFKWNTFYKEVAVGSGFGIRADASFIVLRLDLAFPLRVPYLPNEKWVINSVKPFSSDWRRDNLILNVAIGYPF